MAPNVIPTLCTLVNGYANMNVFKIIGIFAISAAMMNGGNSVADVRQPYGLFCGKLLSSGILTPVETRFEMNASSSTVTGRYVFDETGQKVEGLLVEAGDDGDGNNLTRLFVWRDKYGYGKLAVTFAPNFSEFEGKWSDGGPMIAPWNGKRCGSTIS